MPSFDICVDFEVFCGTCGAGLCNNSDTRESRNRNTPQVTVEVCETCLENAKDEARAEERYAVECEFEKEISELQTKIDELEEQLVNIAA